MSTKKFSHSETECSEFKSIKKSLDQKMVMDNLSQTDPLKHTEVSSQAVKSRGVKIQTDSQIEEEITLYEDDSAELVNFMKKIGPAVCDELDRNGRSYAFGDYAKTNDDVEDETLLLHSCEYKKSTNKLAVTNISWNCTGSVMAVCYGDTDHRDWCSAHSSSVATWNIHRSRFDSSKPDAVVELDSCQSALAFHPVQPSLLAGANFQGHIYIWDLSREIDPMIANTETSSKGKGHREPITSLHWILDPDGKTYNILSQGADGFVIVWYLSKRKGCLRILQRYKLTSDDLPSRLRVRSHCSLAATCSSTSPHDSDTFLVATQCGAVFRCSLDSEAHDEDHIVNTPVKVAYYPHFSHVSDIDLSPFHRNVFATCSSDQSVCISSMLESSDATLTIEPCKSNSNKIERLAWSPQRPMVLILGTSCGEILIFDFTISEVKPLRSLKPTNCPISSLKFNNKQPQLLAVGDTKGVVYIYKLDQKICQIKCNELESLSNLITTN